MIWGRKATINLLIMTTWENLLNFYFACWSISFLNHITIELLTISGANSFALMATFKRLRAHFFAFEILSLLMALIFVVMSTFHLDLDFLFAYKVLIFALKASVRALMPTSHWSCAIFLAFCRVMSSWIIICYLKVMAITLATMTTIKPEWANFVAASFRNKVKIIRPSNLCKVAMVITF